MEDKRFSTIPTQVFVVNSFSGSDVSTLFYKIHSCFTSKIVAPMKSADIRKSMAFSKKLPVVGDFIEGIGTLVEFEGQTKRHNMGEYNTMEDLNRDVFNLFFNTEEVNSYLNLAEKGKFCWILLTLSFRYMSYRIF